MQSHGTHAQANDDGVIFETPFNYAFLPHQTDPTARLPEVNIPQLYEALDNLAKAMTDQDSSNNDSSIPPIFTYWGQFIDHDITLMTDRDTQNITNIAEELPPKGFGTITHQLTNGRIPTLNLDSLYGSGPSFSAANPSESQFLYVRSDPARFIIGKNTDTQLGEIPPPSTDLRRDLPRGQDKRAKIADSRNDENVIVAQFHLAWLRFHNAVLDSIEGKGRAGFDETQKLVRFHYQWLVVNQYLPAILDKSEVDKALDPNADNLVIRDNETFMPIEFSAAAFRFGHTMVRATYDFNRNFGRGNHILPRATFTQAFQFTGGGFPEPFQGIADTLPANWIIEWDRFFEVTESDRSARKIDTKLAIPLHDMQNQGNKPDLSFDLKALLKNLARRNLRRGFQLRVPTGQAVCRSLGVAPLHRGQLIDLKSDKKTTPAIKQALENGNFLDRTPLWFYILREAEVLGKDGKLGPMGSRFIAKAIVGLIKADKESYLNAKWTPDDSPLREGKSSLSSIEKIFKFAGVAT